MLDPASLSWLLLPLGIVLGWVLAGRLRGRRNDRLPADAASAMVLPLDNLSDEAVSTIIRAAAEQPALAELQLIIGALFRRRGEVDRAISVHQNLCADTTLPSELREGAQHELARDYQKAGLMDRAEALLNALVATGAPAPEVLETLLSIHEQARDWRPAIAVAERLQSVQARDLRGVLSHYHCELAEQALAADDRSEARRLARRALELNPASIRTSLLLGDIAEQTSDAVAAIRAYRRVPDQDARFVREVLAPLERCARAIGHPEMFTEFIEEAEQRFPASGAVVLVRARLITEQGGDAASYLLSRLARHPHWSGLLAWIETQIGDQPDQPELPALRSALQQKLKAQPVYRCVRCGLAPTLLFWQCPGCKHWDTVVPDEAHG